VRITDLKSGDILLLENTRANYTSKHLGIIAGQWLTGANVFRSHHGRSSLVHAMIYLVDGIVAEASGESGTVRSRQLLRPKTNDIDDSVNEYLVYRCMEEELGQRAASAAFIWSKAGMGYAKGKAVGSVFHSDNYGKHGKERAQQYADQLNAAAQLSNNFVGPFTQGGAFCTEFVIACYQAAAIDMNRAFTGSVLKCDAKHCSVRALHNRLLSDSLFDVKTPLDLAHA
jgi:hypothetical protein